MQKNKDILRPRCLEGKALGHSNTGHILPCCWVDGEVLKRHELGRKLIHPDLSIDNNETIEDILLSDAWLEWDDMLKNSPEKRHIFVTNIVESDSPVICCPPKNTLLSNP